jgi:hypothetical protein
VLVILHRDQLITVSDLKMGVMSHFTHKPAEGQTWTLTLGLQGMESLPLAALASFVWDGRWMALHCLWEAQEDGDNVT